MGGAYVATLPGCETAEEKSHETQNKPICNAEKLFIGDKRRMLCCYVLSF